MSLKERLNDAMKEAMKAKDSLRLSTIRLIRSAIKNREIDARQELDDAGVIDVLSSLVKQRKESAQVYRDNQRPELAEKEEAELAILQEYLPAQLSLEELGTLIDETIAELGASSQKDMGRVMKVVSAQTKGRADGKVVSEMVKERLSG
ncbi:MAG: GatB/YqeY domain-containing protein [Syntrophotaleaceae bacterium]